GSSWGQPSAHQLGLSRRCVAGGALRLPSVSPGDSICQSIRPKRATLRTSTRVLADPCRVSIHPLPTTHGLRGCFKVADSRTIRPNRLVTWHLRTYSRWKPNAYEIGAGQLPGMMIESIALQRTARHEPENRIMGGILVLVLSLSLAATQDPLVAPAEQY